MSIFENLVNSACMYYRHDFGLLHDGEQDKLRFEAREWRNAWGKTFQDSDYKGEIKMDHTVKPPLGLKPRHIHEEERKDQIKMAISRMLDVNLTIDIDWVNEYNEIVNRGFVVERNEEHEFSVN